MASFDAQSLPSKELFLPDFLTKRSPEVPVAPIDIFDLSVLRAIQGSSPRGLQLQNIADIALAEHIHIERSQLGLCTLTYDFITNRGEITYEEHGRQRRQARNDTVLHLSSITSFRSLGGTIIRNTAVPGGEYYNKPFSRFASREVTGKEQRTLLASVADPQAIDVMAIKALTKRSLDEKRELAGKRRLLPKQSH